MKPARIADVNRRAVGIKLLVEFVLGAATSAHGNPAGRVDPTVAGEARRKEPVFPISLPRGDHFTVVDKLETLEVVPAKSACLHMQGLGRLEFNDIANLSTVDFEAQQRTVSGDRAPVFHGVEPHL